MMASNIRNPAGTRAQSLRRLSRAAPDTGRRSQGGVVLVMSLLFLLMLTILGVTAMGTSALQEKMAGNMRDVDMAFQAAESALRGGEAQIVTLSVTGKPNTACPAAANSIWTNGCITSTYLLDKTWWTANGSEYGGAGKQITTAYSDPLYVLEELEFVEDSLVLTAGPKTGNQYYRISSRGVGKTGASQAVLQTAYRRRYN
jgi:type IV pilus assembly protein PilX